MAKYLLTFKLEDLLSEMDTLAEEVRENWGLSAEWAVDECRAKVAEALADVRGAKNMGKLGAFWLGVKEFRLTCTTNLDAYGLGHHYDLGREWAHRLTLRRYEA